MLLIVQCDCGDQNADLIACARYTVQGELQQVRQDRTADIHVVFLIQLPGIAGGCFTGFQVGIAYCLVLGTQYKVNYNKYDKIEPLTSMWCS
jgi:hypothetical protein